MERIFSPGGADYAAGYFLTRIPGGLGVKIIELTMDDNRFSENVADPEPAGEKLKMRLPLPGQKRRQIADVVGMGDTLRIIMPPGIGKIFTATIAALVDMKGEEIRPGFRQTVDICDDQGAAALGMKSHRAPDARMFVPAPESGDCVGGAPGTAQHCRSRR